jgi:hypothetical protein
LRFGEGGRGKNGRNYEFIAWRYVSFFGFLSIFVMSTYHMGCMHAHTDRMRVDRFGLLLFLPLEMLSLITHASSLYRPFS